MEEEEEWRHGPIRQRLQFALATEVFVDVDFLVGVEEERISAHKLILSLSSRFFHDLIKNHEVKGHAHIQLPTVHPSSFRKLLRFIYTDELEVGDLPELLEIAGQFGFTRLKQQTRKTLSKVSISEENVIEMLNIALKINDLDTELKALRFIKVNASAVFKSLDFDNLSPEALREILKQGELMSLREVDVFRSVRRWGQHQLKKKYPNANEKFEMGEIRDILGPSRLLICYCEIPYDILLSEVKTSGVLNSAEFIQILKTFIDPSDNPLGIVTKPRFNGLPPEEKNSSTSRKRPRNSELQVSPLTPAPLHPPLVSCDNVPIYSDDHNRPDVIFDSFRPSQPEPPPDQLNGHGHLVPFFNPVVDLNGGPLSTSFVLENCSISMLQLMESVAQKQNTLIGIFMKNVQIQNIASACGEKVWLPSLQEFHFVQDFDPGSVQMLPPLPDKSFLDGSPLKDFLFFEKSQAKSWMLSNLLTLGVEININVRGIQFIHFSPEQRKLTLAYPEQFEANCLLENCGSLYTLCLASCEIQSPSRINYSTIVNLVLQSVSVKDMSATRLVNSCHSLENLSLFANMNKMRKGFSKTQINFESNFQKCAQTLTKLSLSSCTIHAWSKKNLQSHVYTQLQVLHLNICDISKVMNNRSGFLKCFPFKFPNLRSFRLRSEDNCRPTFGFIVKLLEIRSLQEISISRFVGEGDSLMNNNIIGGGSGPEEFENEIIIRKFLTEIGLPGVEVSGSLIPDFIIRRQSPISGGGGGNWTVHWDPTELNDETYNFSRLNEFISHPSMLQFIL